MIMIVKFINALQNRNNENMHRNNEEAKKIIDDFEDINKSDNDFFQKNLLCEAACFGNYEIVKYLCDKNDIKINISDCDGDTALIWASRLGHFDVVKLLLSKGADVHITNEYEQTALSEAFKNRNEVIVNMLLNAGADPAHKDRYGKSAVF